MLKLLKQLKIATGLLPRTHQVGMFATEGSVVIFSPKLYSHYGLFSFLFAAPFLLHPPSLLIIFSKIESLNCLLLLQLPASDVLTGKGPSWAMPALASVAAWLETMSMSCESRTRICVHGIPTSRGFSSYLLRDFLLLSAYVNTCLHEYEIIGLSTVDLHIGFSLNATLPLKDPFL